MPALIQLILGHDAVLQETACPHSHFCRTLCLPHAIFSFAEKHKVEVLGLEVVSILKCFHNLAAAIRREVWAPVIVVKYILIFSFLKRRKATCFI
jgi:hypothetical protein